MKLFVVTSLIDYREDVYKIFKQASINVFSATDLVGFRNDQTFDLLEEWFASGEERYDSLMVFSFTSDENAALAMSLLKTYNETSKPEFLIRAFIMPVESSI
ncbi:MAG: hypothetical protein ACHQIM_08365 [Sphingobacteriales bacterium]